MGGVKISELWIFEQNILKQIGVCAGIEHQQGEAVVVLLPHQQPVRLNMTLPRAVTLESRQFVRSVLARKRAFHSQDVNQIGNLVHVKPALDATFDRTLELRRVVYRVHRSIG